MQNGFHIGDSHQVEPSLNSVTGPAGIVRLEPKVMQVLVLLAAHAGQVVAKERLMRTVWPDAFVTDDVLTRSISELRRLFGDDPKEPRFIQTIPKSGYRLIARVSSTVAEGEPATTGQSARLATVALGDDQVVTLSEPSRAGVRDGTWPRAWKLGLWAISLAAGMLVGGVVWGWLGAGVPVSLITIAVLPFEHLGGDPERQYLTDGLTEEISASLGQIDPEFLVKGRSSTKMYKGTTKSLVDIGRELGVDYLVEGSVRAESRRLRVTSKLIRARDQRQIWAESYDSEPGSMLELQRELSTAIARQVRLRLSPDRVDALTRRHSQSAEAYDFYLRGRHSWNQFTPQTNRDALADYKRATKADSEYALAWSGIADVYTASPINSDVPPSQVADLARDAAERGVRYGPTLAETHTAIGYVRYFLDWDLPAAETALRKAIFLDPSYSQAHRLLGLVFAYLGRHDEAREAMRRARELEPRDPIEYALSAHVAFAARDFTSALGFARRATDLDSQFWIGQFQLAQVYERLGDRESMQRALDITERFGTTTKMISLRGYLYARLGRTADARRVLNTLEARALESFVPPYLMALVHAGLDEPDAALQLLERARVARDVNLMFLVVDPKWDPFFRRDPRFLELLNRCDFTRGRARTAGQSDRGAGGLVLVAGLR